MKKEKYIYMLVTKDKYELPLVVADSVAELAKKLSVSPNVIYSIMSHAKKKGRKCRYVKVEYEDESKEDEQ